MTKKWRAGMIDTLLSAVRARFTNMRLYYVEKGDSYNALVEIAAARIILDKLEATIKNEQPK